jgi:hypothetical protein
VKTERSGKYDLKWLSAWVFIFTLLVGQLLAYTWCRVQSIRVGYEISAEAADYQRRLSVQNTLRIELERLRTPERVAAIARRDIGLVLPAAYQQQLIVLNESY